MKLNTTTALVGLAALLLALHLAKKKKPAKTGTARPGSQEPVTRDWWSYAGGWMGATGA